MKKNLLAVFCLILMTISCNQTEPTTKTNTDAVPKAFQEGEYDVSLKRSGSEDLVEQLYAELLEKNKELKVLEEDLNALPDSIQKSTAAYEKYVAHSESYYGSAFNKTRGMGDTILSQKIRDLVEKHRSQYEQQTSDLAALNKLIDKNTFSIADQRVVMKVLLTIPMLEQYQKNQKPDKKVLLKQIKEQQELLKRMEKAVQ